MSKPGTLPGVVRRPTIETQTHIAHAEIKLKFYHLGQPWVCGIGLLALGALVHHFAGGPLTAALAGFCGLVITLFDFHLRATRIHLVARLIGPLTVLAATGWLAYVIAFGFSKPLFLTWLFVIFILGSVVWDVWMSSGEHKDENRQFPVAAGAAGLGGTWFSGLRRHKSKNADASAAPGTEGSNVRTGRFGRDRSDKAGNSRGGLIGTMHLPPGEITPSNAATKIENLEGAMGHPPGSWSLAPDPGNAANSLVKISDPQILDAAPLPWPFGMDGSNPGASIAVPIQPGLWQDGEVMEYCLLRHHLMIVGKTDSGKTMTAAYNFIGEAITRFDYACFAFDITKQDQFFGPMRPALHGLATDPESALKLLNAIHRIRPARAKYLASKNMTEWAPGCGLSFLEFWMEEAADLADMIVNKAFGGTREQLEQWKSDVRAYRSFGGRWVLSTGRNDFQEVPTLIRSQLGHACFGVDSLAEAELGLSDDQRKRGARPHLWGTRVPGKFFIDAPSIPDDRIAMPARGWDWGRDSFLMAEYAAQHPIAARPLDDVTGEALEAEPGPAATSAFAVTQAVTGTPVGGRPNLHVVPDGYRPPKLTQLQTLDILREHLAKLRADWDYSRGSLLIQQKDLVALAKYIDRTPTHMSNLLAKLAPDPAELLVKRDDMRPGRWEILPEPAQQEGEQ